MIVYTPVTELYLPFRRSIIRYLLLITLFIPDGVQNDLEVPHAVRTSFDVLNTTDFHLSACRVDYNGEPSQRIKQFTLQGEYLNTITLPRPIELLTSDKGTLYGISRNDDTAEVVRINQEEYSDD